MTLILAGVACRQASERRVMASLAVDEEVYCKHLNNFYESWKAVSPFAIADGTVSDLRQALPINQA